MDRQKHHECVQRAIELGRTGDPASLPELTNLLKMPSAEIRRLASSAIGKLSGFGADPVAAVAALAPVALNDPHAQTQQYALTALKAYGTATLPHLVEIEPPSKDRRHGRAVASQPFEVSGCSLTIGIIGLSNEISSNAIVDHGIVVFRYWTTRSMCSSICVIRLRSIRHTNR
jgi:hypothetical protein